MSNLLEDYLNIIKNQNNPLDDYMKTKIYESVLDDGSNAKYGDITGFIRRRTETAICKVHEEQTLALMIRYNILWRGEGHEVCGKSVEWEWRSLLIDPTGDELGEMARGKAESIDEALDLMEESINMLLDEGFGHTFIEPFRRSINGNL